MTGSDISPDEFDVLEDFLNGLPAQIVNVQAAINHWHEIAGRLTDYAVGASPSDPLGLMSNVNNLISGWQGKAADEFSAKAKRVRDFGLALAANADSKTQAMTASLVKISEALANLQTRYLALGHEFDCWTDFVTNYTSLLFNAYRHQFLPWSKGCVGLTPWTYNIPTFAEWQLHSMGAKPIVFHYSFPSGCTQAVVTGAPTGSGVLTLVSTDGLMTNAMFTYRSPVVATRRFNFGTQVLNAEWNFAKNQDEFRDAVKGRELMGMARYLVTNAASQHDTLAADYLGITFPGAVDDQGLPQGGSAATGPGNTGVPGGYSPYTGTGTSGTTPGDLPSVGSGAYNPPGGTGTYGGDPGTGGTGGGYTDPYGSAGYQPYGSGGGLGGGSGSLASYDPHSAGLDSGLGLGNGADSGGASGAGLGGSGLDGGAGAGTGSGAATRPNMPMAPSGAGGGKDGEGRSRNAYLTEDEDVWGVDGSELDGVL